VNEALVEQIYIRISPLCASCQTDRLTRLLFIKFVEPLVFQFSLDEYVKMPCFEWQKLY
jgi:hypothetical protein